MCGGAKEANVEEPRHPTETDLTTPAGCELSKRAWMDYREKLRAWVKREEANIDRWLEEADRKSAAFAGGLDEETIRLARGLCWFKPEVRLLDWQRGRVHGNIQFVAPYGEQLGAIRDFKAQLAGGPRGPYMDISKQFFGTKRYESFICQRCDCEPGMGPRHGSITMQIGLHQRIMKDEIPEANANAAIRVLNAILAGNVPADLLAAR